MQKNFSCEQITHSSLLKCRKISHVSRLTSADWTQIWVKLTSPITCSDMVSIDFDRPFSIIDLESFLNFAIETINWLWYFVLYNTWVILLILFQISLALCARLIWNHSPDYSLNCTPLSPITISNRNEWGTIQAWLPLNCTTWSPMTN